MARKKTVYESEWAGYGHAEAFKPEMADLMKKLHITADMSPSRIIMKAREYLEKQTNPIRACNAILFKLGVHKQFTDEPRRARVYAFTAIEESMKNGEGFDPSTVSSIAEKRLSKIQQMMGRDAETIVQDNETPKPKSKKDKVVDIYVKNKDKPTAELIKLIVEKVGVEKQSAYSLLHSARKTMVV